MNAFEGRPEVFGMFASSNIPCDPIGTEFFKLLCLEHGTYFIIFVIN